MMDKFSLVYIDDNPDTALSKYLDLEFSSENYRIDFTEIRYSPDDGGYESLLSDSRIQHANIILVDSWLFENRTATNKKITGEEFKFVLKKYFPFIEVIVITQNEIEEGIIHISKYDKSLGKSASEYYAAILPKVIDKAVTNIAQYRLLAALVEKNDSWEDIIKEKVLATLNGTSAYDDLTTSDVDKLVSAFKEMEGCING